MTTLPNLSAIMAATRPNGEEAHDFSIQVGQRMLELAEGIEMASRSLDTTEEPMEEWEGSEEEFDQMVARDSTEPEGPRDDKPRPTQKETEDEAPSASPAKGARTSHHRMPEGGSSDGSAEAYLELGEAPPRT